MFKKLWNYLFPAHVWSHNNQGYTETRICTVCGQQEELDYGGGMAGSIWISIKDGERAKHSC